MKKVVKCRKARLDNFFKMKEEYSNVTLNSINVTMKQK